MIKLSRRIFIAAGTATVLTGAVLGTSALAATPTPEAGAGTAKTDYRQAFLGKLATALGVDQTKLTDAMKQSESDVIDERVQKGELTKEQGDQMKARIAQGDVGGFGGFGGPGGKGGRGGERGGMGGPGFGGMRDQTVQKAIADKLGLSTAELQTALRSGKTLADLAKDKSVPEADLKAAIKAATKTQLDQAVKNGKLTQAQEDSELARIDQAQLADLGRGGRGGPGGR